MPRIPTPGMPVEAISNCFSARYAPCLDPPLPRKGDRRKVAMRILAVGPFLNGDECLVRHSWTVRKNRGFPTRARGAQNPRGSPKSTFNFAPFGESLDVPMESRSRVPLHPAEEDGAGGEIVRTSRLSSCTRAALSLTAIGGLREAVRCRFPTAARVHSEAPPASAPQLSCNSTGDAPSLIILQLHQTPPRVSRRF